jgi:hypothetical protein
MPSRELRPSSKARYKTIPDAQNPAEAIKMVRGGAICSTDDPAAHIIRGSNQAAVCRPTLGGNQTPGAQSVDTRPRWRVAGRSS